MKAMRKEKMTKSKWWFYICIVQAIVMIGATVFIAMSAAPVKPENADLKEYVSQFSEENNYLPEKGYISDAETAVRVGGAIIDNMCEKDGSFGSVSLYYDRENRLWMVDKGYLFHPGGFVVIEQDSGKVVKALLSK